MITLTFHLKTNKSQNFTLSRRFFVFNKIKNVTIKHTQKLLRVLERDKEYNSWLSEYLELKKSSKSKKRIKELSKLMYQRRKEIGLTNFDLKKWLAPIRRKYARFISSQQGQALTDDIWRAVEKYLFSDGKKIHFNSILETLTIPQASSLNGLIVDLTKEEAKWLGMNFKIDIKHNDYVDEVLSQRKFNYGYIAREMFDSGWRYYVKLIFHGDPPIKAHKYKVDAGVDLGTSTVAVVRDDKVFLENLAPKAKEYNKMIRQLDRKIERSLRITNPENYDVDGKIKKRKKSETKLKWTVSNNCKRLKRKRKSLFRKMAATSLQSHRKMINEMLEDVRTLTIEPMNFKALQRRAKNTERSDKPTETQTKNGEVKTIHKYKKKKRFGYSLSLHSPGNFQRELLRKCELYDIEVREISTSEFKASQFNHDTSAYEKVKLSQRSKVVAGESVQRDLYSAFLIKNSDVSLTTPDVKKCRKGYKKFVKFQNELIYKMKQSGKSNKSCFGF